MKMRENNIKSISVDDIQKCVNKSLEWIFIK